jgi:hypothetical protein
MVGTDTFVQWRVRGILGGIECVLRQCLAP